MTTSCSFTHLNLSQSRERLWTYSLSAFLAITPSKASFTCFLVKFFSFSAAMRAETKRPMKLERLAQQPFSVAQRQLRDGVAVEKQQVEKVMVNRDAASACLVFAIVRAVGADFASVLLGLRRASAFSSLIFTRGQRGFLPLAIRLSA